ncbi:alpha/beta hydrolase [Ulvibacter litoralis]|uniref:Pimeloyl-ACP methyl ester carboxylesterase n=1 Tax=Ulvibacter litoralis TaxID=227084 RepID=A0A1G7F2R6_9FLAO|nr:alpha/beta hydrolase [Ulvibacter litoralis]GHC52884.1 alpha/beta hydrolase [Ulvibacter litoralis]SDE70243.1 Pimeloyl-ACP methyl ester carboxylesterase [Ulvibacter litoralis]
MSTEKIHVYFVPGLAAGKEIFRNISLPKHRYELHIIDWLIPEKKEPLSSYAKRMAAFVREPNSVLIGVSFGGVMVQEMASFLALRKLIIISSVKRRKELPTRLKVVKKTLAYKLVPTSLVLSANDLTRFAIGPKTEKRLRLYQEYLHVRDKQYLDWAIENMVCWQRKVVDPAVVHIHGDSDVVFPVKNIENSIQIPGGTHIMILNKGSVISKKIIEVIENK